MTNYSNWSKSRRGFILLIALIFALAGMSQVVNANPDVPFAAVSIDGPPSATAGSGSVTYTITYSGVPSTGGVQYQIPSGFMVTSTSKAGTTSGNILRWPHSTSGTTDSIEITGEYTTSSCTTSSDHVAEVYDSHNNAGVTATDRHTVTVDCGAATATPTMTNTPTSTPMPTATATATVAAPTALSQSSFDNATPTTTPFWLALLLLSAVAGLVFYRVRVVK